VLVLSIAATETASVPVAGGRAANLGAMIRAGLPVPPGFCITTSAYDEVAAALDLGPLVSELVSVADERSPRAPESSATLRARLLAAPFSPAPRESVAAACHSLDDEPAPVAVRSSATAEDLPDASFAGQQDTCLNVIGVDAVCDAIRRCWASLWNDRAVSYRVARRVDQRAVRLAVVVQRMVPAEVAGVLFTAFTADSVTGRRRRIIISASYGLGEAVVSGLVNPDHFVVEGARSPPVPRGLGIS
jgi:pyruvate,water dikinase